MLVVGPILFVIGLVAVLADGLVMALPLLPFWRSARSSGWLSDRNSARPSLRTLIEIA